MDFVQKQKFIEFSDYEDCFETGRTAQVLSLRLVQKR